MATKIVTKNSSTGGSAPSASDLVQGELAVNVTDKRLYTENNSGAIVELGTNPSTIDINAGTIDGTVIGGTTAAAISGTTGQFGTSLNVDGTATVDGLSVDTSSVGGFKVTNEAASGVRLTAYQGTTNSNVRTAYVDAQEFVVSTGAPTGTTVAERMRIDSSGSVGIGVTPSAWAATIKAIDLTTGGAVYGTATGVSSASNLYNDGNWRAKATGVGTLYGQSGGVHNWYTSASVSAGAVATLTERMRIDSSGKVAIGSTVANKIFNLADPDQGGEALKLHFEANAAADKWAMYAYDRTNGHYANMSFGANALVIDSAGHAIIGGGVTLGNGSTYAAANTLDDYEEGNWTPAVVGGTQTITNITQARYTKIGRSVLLNVYITQSTVTDSTSLLLSGLPFTATSYNATGIVNFSSNSSGSTVACRTAPNATTLSFYKVNVNQAAVLQTQNAGHIIFSITYITDQ